MIAACLPCYAPLYGPGRDVLLRSYQSMFSLASQARSLSSRGRSAIPSAGIHSEVALHNTKWLGPDNTVEIGSSPGNYGEYTYIHDTVPLQDIRGITVTKGVDVVQS
jgi:hypothetical protein